MRALLSLIVAAVVASSAGQGIFSPMTEKQVKAICDEIVSEVVKR
jgi:hypothetical protein